MEEMTRMRSNVVFEGFVNVEATSFAGGMEPWQVEINQNQHPD